MKYTLDNVDAHIEIPHENIALYIVDENTLHLYTYINGIRISLVVNRNDLNNLLRNLPLI